MAKVDEVIRLIAKAQLPDGYVNSYFIVAAPEKRWTDLAWSHELYCAGHLIEAAVAHKVSTGKDSLLDVALRFADCIDRTFGPEEGQLRAVCGHPEIELALFKLYDLTGEPRYRDLAAFFVEERGRVPSAFDGKKPLSFEIAVTKWIGREYFLNHARARAQVDATGHAVRAVYLYAAMADQYAATGDEELLRSLRRLWDSLVSRRMYITGGIGSQAQGERFTADWDLPSDTAYAETCASIGLAFWASRMTEIEGDSRYADVLERALYNGALSGVSLDGTRYFYVNPLEVIPDVVACRQDHEHVEVQRVQWLGCSCCPPNIARLVASIASYFYGSSDDRLWVHHYAESEVEAEVAGTQLRLGQKTDYPWSGAIALEVSPEAEAEFSLMLRIPDWCGSWSCAVNGESLISGALKKGYLEIRRRWKPSDLVALELEMRPRILCADPRIPELAGRLAVQRGPLVFCAESVDNGEGLHTLALDPQAELGVSFDAALMGGSIRLTAEALRDRLAPSPSALPYRETVERESSPAQIVLVPYHQWGNRAPGGEMRVWLRSSL
jgi:DUF1680 family protein